MEKEMERGPAWEQTPSCGARTRVRKPSIVGARFPCARSSRVSFAENGPVPLPREARLSPTSGCADACGRPVEASLTCLACGLCWSRHRRSSPCSAPWGPPRHLGFGLCVYIFGASGASLPCACVGWSEPHPPPHGDPSRGRPRGSQQGPLPQSGCQSLDVSRVPSVGACHSKFTLFSPRSPFS